MLFFILFSLLVISFLLYKAKKNTADININHIDLTDNNSKDSFSILHLSDLHMENISLTPNDLALKLENKQIDLIALTGDFLDRKKSIPKLIPYLKVLQNINPKYGMYAVLGNHDYVLKKSSLEKLIDVLEQHNCPVLQNESRTISVDGKNINIIGIDNYSTNHSDIAQAYKKIQPGKNIVLTHDPNIVLEMEGYSFDYLMAGHFHGGQICYPKAFHLAKMGKLPRKNIIKGLHRMHNASFYISEGLGQTGVNIRIGSRPEIAFHKLSIS
ncbi:MAG TPA: metallophosphoesterase [Cerasibacillus sp.]|uniref:metallophosphoesterase n=1 Tax=Cerasibacillus sp. TaxID=2498711 RepID=UPI002F41B1FE